LTGVCDDYDPSDNAFTGTINKMVVKIKEDSLSVT
jgi:hypothetical protein